MRSAFRTTVQFTQAYAFVHQVTRGACSLGQFIDLVRRADARGVWAFVGLRYWAVPFILASLADFESPDGLRFRFVMSRMRGGHRQTAWGGMETGRLRKHFAIGGKPYQIGRYIDLQVTSRMFHDVITSSPFLKGRRPLPIVGLQEALAAL